MKAPVPLLLLLFFAALSSCSTDVILYTDYRDIPVVYGIVDVNADTNFIKITKAFYSDNDHPINPFEAALVYDSSNYPDKLDAFIVEKKSVHGQAFQPTGRKLSLDTVTIHNKKPGLFYSPHQKLYYTTERFNTNHDSEKYRYQLCVVKPDHDTVTAETGIVAGSVAIDIAKVNFQSEPSERTGTVFFIPTEEGVLYEIGMQFHYREIHEGQPEALKEVSWSYGAKPLGAYEMVVDNCYKLHYSVNSLFRAMERAIGNDTVWDVNHPNVVRYIDDFVVYITVAGEDFYNYYQTTQGGIAFQSPYSNVEGGCGLFSSRILVRKTVGLSARAKYDLFCEPWGFREQ